MPESSAAPDWLEDTPQLDYILTIETPSDEFYAQKIEVTKEEYIALKGRLAKMRGYTVNGDKEEDASTAPAL